MALKGPRLIAGYDPYATRAPGEYYDEEAAERAVRFFPACLSHIKGPKAGQPLTLHPVQADVTRTLFGWRKKDGRRRYRQLYYTTARKNGKTTFGVGLAAHALYSDFEPGAECYTAACDREQAGLSYALLADMVERSPILSKHSKIKRSVKRIIYKDRYLRALPVNEGSTHGFHAHFVLADELHGWKSREFYDALITSMGARANPIFAIITTNGFDRLTICGEQYDYACKIRDGILEDSSYLPIIFDSSPEDDWRSPETWAKANPLLGDAVMLDYLERECRRAIDDVGYENTFRRLHCNQWTTQRSRWLKLDQWAKCAETPTDIPDGANVVMGLDLAETTDLAALCIRQKLGEGSRLRWIYWLPEERVRELEKDERIPYSRWAREGHVRLIPGAKIDQSYIERDILELKDRYKVGHIAYDPWHADLLCDRLKEQGLTTVKISPGFAKLSKPAKEFHANILAGKLAHDNNPVTNWCVSNVEKVDDVNGNIRPVRPEKNAARKKIDGVMAAVLCYAVAWSEAPRSVYERRGIITV